MRSRSSALGRPSARIRSSTIRRSRSLPQFQPVEQRDRLGPARRVGKILEKAAHRGDRRFDVVGRHLGLGLHDLPALVMLDEVASLLHLTDLGREDGGAILQIGQLLGDVGRGRAIGHLNRRRFNGPLGLLDPRDLRFRRPKKAERGMPGEEAVPSSGNGGRGVVALEGEGSLERQGVVTSQRRENQGGCRNPPKQCSSPSFGLQGIDPRTEPRGDPRLRIPFLVSDNAALEPG